MLDVTRHHVHLFFGHLAAGLPVRHAGRRAIGDEDLEVVRALAHRDVGRERLAGGALAQHAVAARAALEVHLARHIELGLRHGRRLGVHALHHGLGADGGTARLVVGLGLADALFVLRVQGAGNQHGRHRERAQDDLGGFHGFFYLRRGSAVDVALFPPGVSDPLAWLLSIAGRRAAYIVGRCARLVLELVQGLRVYPQEQWVPYNKERTP
ncbi:hypothetical protein D9M69_535780 [compost metagenome]